MNVFSGTDVGLRRKINQDYVFASEFPVGCLPNLFLVADGMGGHNAGDFASRFVVNTVKELIEKSTESEPIPLLEEAIQKSNELLRAEASKKEEYWGMGTTLVAAAIIDRVVYVANVGDSRFYLLEESQIKQITQDHSLVEEMVRIGQLTKEEARLHPDKNIITRAIGACDDVQVDFFVKELPQNSKFLMCSDGLTNMVEDLEILKIAQGEGTVEERALQLIQTANDHGGKDNIAVILVEPDTNEVEVC